MGLELMVVRGGVDGFDYVIECTGVESLVDDSINYGELPCLT